MYLVCRQYVTRECVCVRVRYIERTTVLYGWCLNIYDEILYELVCNGRASPKTKKNCVKSWNCTERLVLFSKKKVCVWSFVLKIIIKLTLDNKFCDDNKNIVLDHITVNTPRIWTGAGAKNNERAKNGVWRYGFNWCVSFIHLFICNS